jgi:hypothetical protein
MMGENISRNMYISQGIINYSTQLHLVVSLSYIILIIPSEEKNTTLLKVVCGTLPKNGKLKSSLQENQHILFLRS